MRPACFSSSTRSHRWRARLRIEPGCGLIEKQQLRIAHQRAGHGQPLLLPAGERAHARAALLLQLRRPDGFVHRDATAKEAAEEPQRLFDRELVGNCVSCSWMPMRWRSSSAPVAQFSPSSSTVPASGAVSPSQISMVVVLPAPFGPSRPKHSPRVTSRSRPSTATTSAKALRSPRSRSDGPFSLCIYSIGQHGSGS